MYNTIFIGLPPFIIGVFEKDIDDKIIEKHPELYANLQSSPLFGSKTIVTWLLISLYHSAGKMI